MRSRIWVACSLAVIAGFTLFCVLPSQSNGQAKINGLQATWEYKVVGHEGNEKTFNELGEHGWELVAVAAGSSSGAGAAGHTPAAFYFKRKK
jgi:hypothetical protein